MESLNDTQWDVVIRATGIEQSLVALVLHLDSNNYYGGPDAAFSLQEAEAWVEQVNKAATSLFSDASLSMERGDASSGAEGQPALSFSRAYSLSLSPQIIYNRSRLLAALVSSKVFRQLEFQAIGSWWVYEKPPAPASATPRVPAAEDAEPEPAGIGPAAAPPPPPSGGRLQRVPAGREDVFADPTTDPKAKRALMKFLKFVRDYEQHGEQWAPYARAPFADFLAAQFGLPRPLHTPLLAICMAPAPFARTTTALALPRIARHLRSIGAFGPGFGAVVAKWGGGSEIAQVACRAGAVGGAVYMLGNDVDASSSSSSSAFSVVGVGETAGEDDSRLTAVRLRSGDQIKARWIVESTADASLPPPGGAARGADDGGDISMARMLKAISVVSSPLSSLFPVVAEGAPQPAGAVIVFPPGSLHYEPSAASIDDIPPVYVIAHSSETGECPAGQCVLYASVLSTHDGLSDFAVLDSAVERLLEAVNEEKQPRILLSLRYSQRGRLPVAADSELSSSSQVAPPATSSGPDVAPSSTRPDAGHSDNVLRLPVPSLDLVFDDGVLDAVKSVWQQVRPTPSEAGESGDRQEGGGQTGGGESVGEAAEASVEGENEGGTEAATEEDDGTGELSGATGDGFLVFEDRQEPVADDED